MKTEILDNEEIENSQNINPLILVALGIFTYLFLEGFTFIFQKTLNDSLVYSNINPELGYWLIEIGKTLLIILSVTVISQKIKSAHFNGEHQLKILLRNIIILAFAIQILQFFYGILIYEIWPDDFIYRLDSWNKEVLPTYVGLLPFGFMFLNYFTTGYILLKKSLEREP